jgi:hypothetical protein
MDNNDVQLKVGDIVTLDEINTEVTITPINDGVVTTPKKNEENTVSETKSTLEQLKEKILKINVVDLLSIILNILKNADIELINNEKAKNVIKKFSETPLEFFPDKFINDIASLNIEENDLKELVDILLDTKSYKNNTNIDNISHSVDGDDEKTIIIDNNSEVVANLISMIEEYKNKEGEENLSFIVNEEINKSIRNRKRNSERRRNNLCITLCKYFCCCCCFDKKDL